MIISENRIKPYKNCINIVYDIKGMIYEIPNYCINEPYDFAYDEELEKFKSNNKVNDNTKEKILIVNF